jgi:hypothetical protein
VLHQIGVGALGPVFRTYEPERDRLVAVKVFRLDITPEQAQSLADELSRASEAGLFHPSIVEPIAAGVEGTVAYCAEEYVAAESLDVAMRHYAPAPIATVLPFITQLAGAIDFARAAGVGHGALHPRDIFVTPEEARATGFGVVEALERVGLRAPVRRPYSPPERISGQPWDTSADVFSLAAITYELLTGRRPAGLGTEIGTLTAGTPNSWMDMIHTVLARAMDADPRARHSTALAFASALEAAAHGQLAEQPQPLRHVAPAAAAAAPLVAPAPPAPDVDDISAERDEDEADYRLSRDEEATVADTLVTDLDGDIAAEAEADRFAADDFLLDAAGAASAAPEPPSLDTLRAADMPVDPLALEDDEVMVDEPPSRVFEPQDLLHEQRATRPTPLAHAPTFAYPAADETVAEDRSRWPMALLVLLALAAGVGAGWLLRGRMMASPAQSAETATTTGPATAKPNQAPAGREYSEQAVAPPAASGANAPAAAGTARGAGGAGERTSPAAAAPAAAKPPSRPAVTTGTLVVRSVPSGASVTLNGKWRGRTPLTIEQLALQSYDVRVVRPGFQTATQSIALTSDAPERAVSLRLQQAARAAAPPPPETPASAPGVYTGSIYVDSRPRGARVSVDGKPVGVTPLRVPEIRIGSHVVRLELPDHRIWSSTATVVAGQERRVTGSLERIQ